MTSWNALISEYSANLIYFLKSSNLLLQNKDLLEDINKGANQNTKKKKEKKKENPTNGEKKTLGGNTLFNIKVW